MQIKTQTDWAIRILIRLSEQKSPVLGRELADMLGISENYLPRVVRQLRKAGLVSSYAGAAGGYMLTADTEKLTLLDVMNATNDAPCISCYHENEDCPTRYGSKDSVCQNYQHFQRIAEMYFSSVTVQSLMKPNALDSFYKQLEAEGLEEAVEAT